MLKLLVFILLLVAGVENACKSGCSTVARKFIGGQSKSLDDSFLKIFSTFGEDPSSMYGRNSEILSNQLSRTTLGGVDEARAVIGLKPVLIMLKGITVLIGATCLKLLLTLSNSSRPPMRIMLGLGRIVGSILGSVTRIVLQATSLLVRGFTLANLFGLLNPTSGVGK